MRSRMGDDSGNDDDSIANWMILSTIAGISFWVQAIITEERFVPALNVIAEYYQIPDDVAGATLMAAGASSPELFSSLTALFITNSSLGLGTIVGSEIFNQLIICAGAIFASRHQTLTLDPVIVTREMGWYAVAILLLYIALQDVRLDDNNNDDGQTRRIYITFPKALMVFLAYGIYVCVCANMNRIRQWWDTCKSKQTMERSSSSEQRINADDDLDNEEETKRFYFLNERPLLKTEPSENFNATGEATSLHRTSSTDDASHHYLREDIETSPTSILQRIKFFLHTEKPSNVHGLDEIETLEVSLDSNPHV